LTHDLGLRDVLKVFQCVSYSGTLKCSPLFTWTCFKRIVFFLEYSVVIIIQWYCLPRLYAYILWDMVGIIYNFLHAFKILTLCYSHGQLSISFFFLPAYFLIFYNWILHVSQIKRNLHFLPFKPIASTDSARNSWIKNIAKSQKWHQKWCSQSKNALSSAIIVT